MAIGIMTWCHQQLDEQNLPLPALSYHPTFDSLVSSVKSMLERAIAKSKRTPSLLVIGAGGRCGKGAFKLAEDVGLSTTKWGINETASGGPYPGISYLISSNS